ncbi:3',5'-cyclic-nucleotide phosphodiesterase [Fistulifera solaris]|uniref:Phosphodiesterase n=1 Tax=Fistulifera solaris TaxID=1519565 RepID=A0A1Z5JHA9_FISSO|nr:3',5'-cyclic-nucleotide phosphodiesterase [Fistulifera solaris]|eukprot:GAX13385.1 3',5'-cyclic-nucleotide phosphodiesterase [Fistulifera solaris]
MKDQPPFEGSSSSKHDSSNDSINESVSQDGLLVAHERWLKGMKVAVGITLILSALTVALTVFYVTKDSENEEFRVQYERATDEVARVSVTKVTTLLEGMRELSTSTTSLLASQNAAWPQVTVPYFDRLGTSFSALTETKALIFSPVVQDLVEWTLYAQLGLNDEFYSLQTANGQPVDSEGPYAPVWQVSPYLATDHAIMSLDLMSLPSFANAVQIASESQVAVLSDTVSASDFSEATSDTDNPPYCLLVEPVYKDLSLGTSKMPVAYFSAIVAWDAVLDDIVHGHEGAIEAVLENSCGSVSTYQLHGTGDVSYKGFGDLHDQAYSDMKISFELANSDLTEASTERVLQQTTRCVYMIHLYPTTSFVGGYSTMQPAFLAVSSVLIFLFTAVSFLILDYAVRKKTKLSFNISQTKQLIAGVAPTKIEHQMTKEDEMIEEARRQMEEAEKLKEKQMGGKTLMDADESQECVIAFKGKPIADLYVATTIFFADICGFTAWSSVREPTQVFQLLESIFFQFDDIARQMGVFKVETVGDCYVAVSGLPEPREDHFVVMARFAQRCQKKMAEVTESLELKLGPDTGELALRCGLHSGPVTAGVLRGERSRLQLFGDTMNTTSRIETSGKPHLIHVSPETAELLKNNGKENWLVLREDIVVAKGKGAIQTYWLKIDPNTSNAVSVKQCNAVAAIVSRGEAEKDEVPMTADEKKTQRLIDWNCDILLNLLKKIVQKRSKKNLPVSLQRLMRNRIQQAEKHLGKGGNVIEEIVEIIPMPEADNDHVEQDAKDVEIDPQVRDELRNLVTILSKMYHDNPFHCFEHASHVTMSVTKLLSRIVKSNESQLQDQTYGITSDPLTQFAVVLAALIHDVDHRGVPNFVLIKQDPAMAAAYANKSVAEQNSVDLAWNILMDKEFANLRDCLFSTEDDLRRMRQLIVNSVMATDIFDKDLGLLRKKRWEDAFYNNSNEAALTQVHRKATIVIEHLIQASDVSHTMQHWHVYQKWNERLFEEMYLSYKAGLLENDPSVNWYKGEIGFFDNYVIPLTKKLKDCGVFGVSSDEYLNYATNNRAEWEKKGEEIVQKFLKKYS